MRYLINKTILWSAIVVFSIISYNKGWSQVPFSFRDHTVVLEVRFVLKDPKTNKTYSKKETNENYFTHYFYPVPIINGKGVFHSRHFSFPVNDSQSVKSYEKKYGLIPTFSSFKISDWGKFDLQIQKFDSILDKGDSYYIYFDAPIQKKEFLFHDSLLKNVGLNNCNLIYLDGDSIENLIVSIKPKVTISKMKGSFMVLGENSEHSGLLVFHRSDFNRIKPNLIPILAGFNKGEVVFQPIFSTTLKDTNSTLMDSLLNPEVKKKDLPIGKNEKQKVYKIKIQRTEIPVPKCSEMVNSTPCKDDKSDTVPDQSGSKLYPNRNKVNCKYGYQFGNTFIAAVFTSAEEFKSEDDLKGKEKVYAFIGNCKYEIKKKGKGLEIKLIN